ncbi:MAG: carboxypeptidase regulatory-like domain-containing protein [Pseudomonadota bacterium]
MQKMMRRYIYSSQRRSNGGLGKIYQLGITLLAALMLAGCPQEPTTGRGASATNSYSISGVVTDDAGAPLQGVTVVLSGTTSATTTSDAKGYYIFEGLANGDYAIATHSDKYKFAVLQRTMSINRASVANINCVGSMPTTPTPPGTTTPPPTTTFNISGLIVDGTNAPVSGVIIALSGSATMSTTTNTSGRYTFTGLAVGAYTVTPAQTNTSFTPVSRAVNITRASANALNFTTAPVATTTTYSIAGNIATSSGSGINGVTLTLSGGGTGSVTTDANGNYIISGLNNGVYTVTPSLTGYSFVPSNRTATLNNANVAGINYVGTPPPPPTYTLSGRVTNANGTAINGVTLALSGAATKTAMSNNTGNYTFTGLVAGTYTVAPNLSGYTFTPTTQTIAITAANVGAIDFSGALPPTATYTITGQITSGTGTAVSGATVSLSGTATASTTADASGNYSFTNLVNGSYTVTPALTGYTFAPTNIAVTVNGADVSNTNFSGTPPASAATYTISGKIANSSGVAVSGVAVTLGATTTTSDTSGDYSFSGLSNGAYTLTPNLSGYSFTPATASVTITGANVSATDFVAIAPTPGTRNFTLYIKPGTLTVNGGGGAAIPAWSYTDVATTPKFPGPVLNVTEGDTVNVTLQNDHTLDHNFVVKGIATDITAVAPGASKTYTFTATDAGAYLYYDSLNNNINREMGLYGAIIVAPVSGGATAWTGGPSYTFQRLWVTGDMDKTRWNDVAATGATVDTGVYKANYFLINGMGGEDAMLDKAKTAIDGRISETALVRILNAGQYPQTFHFHANHVEVINVNGVRRVAPYKLLDVLQVPPLGSVEVLFKLNQLGKYPMHNHTAQMETANGTYLNGVATLIYINP